MTDAIHIRDYPESNDAVEYSLPNQIVHDLRGTFGHRAVGLVREDGEVLEWYAHHNDHNRVVEWWPEYYEEPLWNGHSIYAFSNALKYYDDYRLAMYEWPDAVDADAEVVL